MWITERTHREKQYVPGSIQGALWLAAQNVSRNAWYKHYDYRQIQNKSFTLVSRQPRPRGSLLRVGAGGENLGSRLISR